MRSFLDLDYSYDPANYHPLGIKLFSALDPHARQPPARHHRNEAAAAGTLPLRTLTRRSIEKEKSFYQVRDATEENPYLWNFDLCSLTLANLRYRRMSLVRDYEAILDQQLANPAFETTFSLASADRWAASCRQCRRSTSDSTSCRAIPTQATAIAEARRGESYIIQGPPGTGKSQTITNLIADFVARGKRVLFVCEKRAAIDVVFARLKQCGLGPLCSLIHDSQTDKKEFILDLKQTYELFTEESPAAAPPHRGRHCSASCNSNLGPLAQFEEAMEGESARRRASAAAIPRPLCAIARRSRPELTPELAERLPTYHHWWPYREQLAGLDVSLRDLEPSGILARHPLRRLRPDLALQDRPMEAVSAPRSAGR